ncbi:hypothetical protein ARMGADRAFT_1090086 [Armillaria gallica]|uniref:JmjC domain-containing protein n=1 Tax=Armillaria gallica TaxID=47427 RepID=A0A2H3D578_ARMGA|nr:hypothetical protein ARMGADRAFT_1090086 [Armillaria gallica]
MLSTFPKQGKALRPFLICHEYPLPFAANNSKEFPKQVTTWSLVSTHGPITYIHSDSQGVGTAIRVLTGQKLWYIFRRMYTKPNDSKTDKYLQEWEPGFIPDPKDWDTEVVLLEPGIIFFMHLDTHHAVITIENSIVVGEHFYVCTTLS